MIALTVLGTLIMITLDTSLEYLRILPILNLIFGKFISTRRLRRLPRKFICVTWISYNPRISSTMSTFCKRIFVNTAAFSNWSGRSLLPTRRIIKKRITLQMITLYKLIIQSKNTQSKLTLGSATVGMSIDMVEVHLSGQTWVVTVVTRGFISTWTASLMETLLVRMNPIFQQEI